jgi:glycosyltransferase involved in cell wall biosynthesis
MKFAFVSFVVPPTWSGQAVVIHRILGGLDPSQYVVITRDRSSDHPLEGIYSTKLPGTHYFLKAEVPSLENTHDRGLTWVQSLLALPRILLLLIRRTKRFVEIVRKEKCEAIVACTAEPFDLPAACAASVVARIPFYPYFFDRYLEQGVSTPTRLFTRFVEPILAWRASTFIVPNEFLRDDLRARYGVESAIVHNPCDLAGYMDGPPTDRPMSDEGVRIVYTGAIYEAHFGAFRTLIQALDLLGRPDVKLHLYTAQPPEELEAYGISGPIVHHGHQKVDAMPAIQHDADVLFLPLAFDSPYPNIIRTSAPGKMGEYLASRRPILVHAPADSFPIWYFREHRCGVVVAEPDPTKLARAIEELLADEELGRRISENAWNRAVSDFSIDVSRLRFADLLEVRAKSPSAS